MMGRIFLISIVTFWIGCSADGPDETSQLLRQFRASKSLEDLERLYEKAATSSKPCVEVYKHIRKVISPQSMDEKLAAIRYLDDHRKESEAALLNVAFLRNGDVLGLYLECVAIFMERWDDARWRSQVIEAFAEYQAELVTFVQERLKTGQLENTSDQGRMHVFKTIHLACDLADLAERYTLREHLPRKTTEMLDKAVGLANPERRRFEPPKYPVTVHRD
jgi:hypothetical protein